MGSILRERENQKLKDAAAANSGVGAKASTIVILISHLNRDNKQGVEILGVSIIMAFELQKK